VAQIDRGRAERRLEPGSREGSGVTGITFACSGEYWTIGREGASFSLRDTKGLTYIQRLLQHPGEEFHALDLINGPGIAASSAVDSDEAVAQLRERQDVTVREVGDAGEMLDEQAKLQYKRRLHELTEELEDLRERGAHARAEVVESEIDFIQREVARAVDRRGRNRRAGSTGERARLNVTRAIKSVIEKVAERDSALGKLLDRSIRTGLFCSYVPDSLNPTNWRFSLSLESERAIESSAPVFRRSESAFAQTVAGRKAFVGREAESVALDRILEQARNGRGRVVMISGAPGVGKTRIAAEFCIKAQRSGATAYVGGCSERDDPAPFLPFVEILEAALAAASSPEAFRDALGDEAAEVARLMPQLSRMFPDIPPPLKVPPEQSRRLLLSSTTKVIERAARTDPVILVLEDLHWADEGTLSLLEHLARSISTMRVIVIGTYRDSELDPTGPLMHSLEGLIRQHLLERTDLHGLSTTAVGEMIRGLTGHEPAPALVSLISSTTEGNPFFIEELFQHLVERGRLNPEGELRDALNVEDIEVPDNVLLVLRRRLARLSDAAQKALGTAAVIGGSFTFELLHAAAGGDAEELLGCIEEAEGAGVITSTVQYPEARFRFAHELIRRTIIEGHSAARRQRMHLNIAQAIELLYANALEEHAEDLAHHFWGSGAAADPAKAVRYLQMAGEKAVRSSANVEAIGHFRKALQLIRILPETQERLRQELSLEISLGAALMATKGFPTGDVIEVYARARELSERLGEATQLFRVLWGQWQNCTSRREHRAALELGQQCLRVAQSAKDPMLLAQAHQTLGAGYCTTGDFTEALGHLEQAITVHDPVRQRSHADLYGHDPAVWSLILSGWALWFLGYPDRALKRNDEGLALAQKLSHPATSAMAAAFAAMVQQFCRNAQAVEELAGLAVDLSTRHDISWVRVMGTILGGWATTQRDQKEAGIARMRLALEALRASGAVLMMGYFSLLLAGAYGEVEQPEEGLRVLAAVDSTREHQWAAELYRLKGELLLKRGEHHLVDQAEAEQCFHHALTISTGYKAKSLELRAAMSLSHLWLRQGKRLEARQALGEIFGSFTEGFDTPDLRDAKMLLEEL
jgi:tetratricopeptide (TPR) repeat protein/RecA/RadA recombinase